MTTKRERWDQLLQRCGWTGQIPAGTPDKTREAAHALMVEAQQSAKTADWPMAELRIRGATGMLLHATDAAPEGKREADARRKKMAAANKREQARVQAEKKADRAKHEAALAGAFDADKAWALIKTTIDRVGATLQPCPQLPDRSLAWGDPIDQAWRARDMDALRAACTVYERRWLAWWDERKAG